MSEPRDEVKWIGVIILVVVALLALLLGDRRSGSTEDDWQ